MEQGMKKKKKVDELIVSRIWKLLDPRDCNGNGFDEW